jgi:hypothetical protein
MRIPSHPLASLFVLLTVVAAAGCGQEDQALAPVRGRVFFRGEPLSGGSIVFTPNPDKGGSGPLARAEIAADGAYTLRSGDRPGAVPGWHRVTVVCVRPADEPSGEGKFTEVRCVIPHHYSLPDLSGLEGLVAPDRDNVLDFYLD